MAVTITKAAVAVNKIALTMTTDDQTNIVWVRSRIFGNGNAWSAASDTFKRTGDGVVIMTGLLASTNYDFIAYDDGINTDWSAPWVALTTGTCSVGANPNWSRWIFASISKHFDDCKGDLDLYIEGQYRDLKPAKDFIELRVDGPFITELTKGEYKLRFEVNVMVQSRMDDINYHRIYTDVGKVSSIFLPMQVYKYGTGSEDTGESFGCLKLLQSTRTRERIQVNHFGQIEPEVPLVQASVEGHYEITLKK